jgi:hypothetical protein
MSTPVVTVVRGGIPVTDSAYGLPVTEAAAGLAVTTVASGGLPIAGRAAPFFNNAGAANFTKVLAGYTAMKAGTRNMNIAIMGNSTDRGVDETAVPYNSQYPLSLAEQLAKLFRADGIPSGANNWYGISGTSLNDYVIRDSRVTVAGTAAAGSSIIQGGGDIGLSSATAQVTFTPQQNCNAADIYAYDFFAGATVSWRVDGGAPTNIVQVGNNTIRKSTIALGAVGPHTVAINWVSGNNVFFGIDCYDNTRKEVTFRQWAISGGTTASMIDNTGAPHAGRLQQITNFPVDLALGDIGLVNSWRNAVAVATVKTQAETLIDAVHTAGGDFIFCVPPFDSSSAGNSANQQQYIDAVVASCIAKGCAVFDIRSAWKSKAASDAAGYSSAADAVHPTIAGQASRALLLRSGLRFGMGL